MTTPVSFGIDVCKNRLDVSTSSCYWNAYDNTDAGRQTLVREVLALHHQQPIHRICIESTGSYSLPVVEALHAAGLPVCHVQPNRVRKFAESEGMLAKTDRIDALMIARFGEQVRNVRTYQPPSEATKSLRALVARREQIVADRVREQGRLEACTDRVVAELITKRIASLRADESEIDALIAEQVHVDDDLRTRCEVMADVKGIGLTTATHLLARVPELGFLNRQGIAALCGLAPYDHSSGNTEGKKRRRGGRRCVADLLYWPVITAIRSNEHIKTFYRNLLQKGKLPAVARVACARKLLVYLNTLLGALNNETPAPAQPA